MAFIARPDENERLYFGYMTLINDCTSENCMVMTLLPMISQMILSSEGFTTNFTTVWAFVRMCAFVDEKIITFSKMATTVLAYEFFLCSEMNRRVVVDVVVVFYRTF